MKLTSASLKINGKEKKSRKRQIYSFREQTKKAKICLLEQPL